MKIKTLLAVIALSLPVTLSFANEKGQVVNYIGFDCANDVLDVIPMLGRGTDFPHFLIQDIDIELKRQHKSSVLKVIECTGQPELKASTVTLDDKDVIDKLSLSFPLTLEVTAGKQVIKLNVNQEYFVENLDSPGKQKVTQKFIVN